MAQQLGKPIKMDVLLKLYRHFIPEYEFPGVSAALEGFDPFFFSMRTLSVAKKKDDIITRLNVLADSYENWIQKKLVHDSKWMMLSSRKKLATQ